MKSHKEEVEEEGEEEQKKMELEKVAAEAIGPMKSFWSFNPLAPLLLPVQRVLLSIARRQRALKAVCNGRDDPVATATVAFAFFLTGLTVFIYTELIHPLVMWSLVQVEHLVVYALHLIGIMLYGPVWKSTSASGALGTATPSSRCRVDGVEVDAMISTQVRPAELRPLETQTTLKA